VGAFDHPKTAKNRLRQIFGQEAKTRIKPNRIKVFWWF
jgi:hypothetical protein